MFFSIRNMDVNSYTTCRGKFGLKYLCGSDFERFCTLSKSTKVNLNKETVATGENKKSHFNRLLNFVTVQFNLSLHLLLRYSNCVE